MYLVHAASALDLSAPTPPQILPSGRLFVGSVTVSFAAAATTTAPEEQGRNDIAVIYTLDGSDPSTEPGRQSSYAVIPGSAANRIVFDVSGVYVIKAMTVLNGVSASDIVMKRFEVVSWQSEPEFQLPKSPYGDDTFLAPLNMTVRCPHEALGSRADLRVCVTVRPRQPFVRDTVVCRSCREPFRIEDTGSYNVTAYFSIDGVRISNATNKELVVKRPSFDVKNVLVQKNHPFQYKPVVDVFGVSKDLNSPTSPSYCAPTKRVVPGHHIILHNPIGHIDFLEPAARCGRGLSLPSDTGRNFSLSSAGLAYTRTASYASMLSRMSQSDIEQWRAQHESSISSGVDGCSIVSNGGFFDIHNFDCFGNLVSGGRVIQTSTRHNVNFGIRDGQFYIGYIDLGDDAAVGSESPFDTLISGLVWLVRNGRSYVAESMRSAAMDGDGEDMSAQSNGPAFATILSARTAIGYDSEGRLMLVQMEGESFVRGMSLYEFAEFLVELGFESAINLDGGGSATVTARNELLTEPSWRCSSEAILSGLVAHDDDAVSKDLLPPGSEYRVCEKPVSSIMCIHVLPPPSSLELQHAGIHFVPHASRPPSPSPSSRAPTARPSQLAVQLSQPPSMPPTRNELLPVSGDAGCETCQEKILSMESSLLIYKMATFLLAIIVLVFVLYHTVSGRWTEGARLSSDRASGVQMSSFSPRGGAAGPRRDVEVGGGGGDAGRRGASPGGGANRDSGVESSSSSEGSDEEDETSSLTKSPQRAASASSSSSPSPAYDGKRASGSINPFSKRKF